jgi:hypothetical protein
VTPLSENSFGHLKKFCLLEKHKSHRRKNFTPHLTPAFSHSRYSFLLLQLPLVTFETTVCYCFLELRGDSKNGIGRIRPSIKYFLLWQPNRRPVVLLDFLATALVRKENREGEVPHSLFTWHMPKLSLV